jgi:hypothetical protein
MPDMPRIHPREPVIAAAKQDLSDAISAMLTQHDLSYAELFVVLLDTTNVWAYHALHDERKAPKETT